MLYEGVLARRVQIPGLSERPFQPISIFCLKEKRGEQIHDQAVIFLALNPEEIYGRDSVG